MSFKIDMTITTGDGGGGAARLGTIVSEKGGFQEKQR